MIIVGTLGYALYQMRGDQWITTGNGTVAETMSKLESKLTGQKEVEVRQPQVTTSVESGIEDTGERETGVKTASSEGKTEQTADGATETEKTTAKEANKNQGKPLYYTVQKGDTLAAISRRMYTTSKYASQIAKANNLANEDEIFIGQKILIPSIE